MKIRRMVSKYTTNTYLVEVDNDLYIIDPGVNFKRLDNFIIEGVYEPKAILLTHGHFDHIISLKELSKYYNIPIYCSEKAPNIMRSKHNCCYMAGQEFDCTLDSDRCKFVKDGDVIDGRFTVIATPGHTDDGLSYKIENNIFTGDTLFDGNVGRTDVFSSSQSDLDDSILKLMKYDCDILPGHGDASTTQMQILNNPYVRDLKLRRKK